MSLKVCRLCGSITADKQCTSLFTCTGLQHAWASRINRILGIEVAIADGLSKQICRACKTRLEAFERAEEDWAAFTEMANKSYKSYRTLVPSSRPVKRTKVSSGDVWVSPDTATARQPAKKLSSRRLDFGPSSMTEQRKESSIFIKIINITLWSIYYTASYVTPHRRVHPGQQQHCSLIDSEVPPSPVKLVEPLPLQASSKGRYNQPLHVIFSHSYAHHACLQIHITIGDYTLKGQHKDPPRNQHWYALQPYFKH